MTFRAMLTAATFVVLTACGGGGEGIGGVSLPTALSKDNSVATMATTPPDGSAKLFTKAGVAAEGSDTAFRPLALSPWGSRIPVAVVPNSITLHSESGDYIGGGKNYAYSRTNALLAITATQGRLTVKVTGDQNWTGVFALPNAIQKLQTGTYDDLVLFDGFNVPASGGLNWSGEARSCGMLTGSLTIDSVSYVGDVLETIDLRFEQYCEGRSSALQGQIHWTTYDNSVPPGPVTPPPADLWAPAAGATPYSGSYIYLVSDTADFVGQGKSYTYSRTNAAIGVTAEGGSLTVEVGGDETWWGDFLTMYKVTRLQPGYYGDLQKSAVYNPVKGGISWFGEGRACNTLRGWFVVDAVTYNGTELQAIDLRFEQHCEGETAALRGQIHWTAGDTAVPPGPINPPPTELWAPAAGTTPLTGNYVYLVSDPGDWVGSGASYLYTPATSAVTIDTRRGHLWLTVDGQTGWRGDFITMNALNQLQPGYYGDLQAYPFHNPAKGGLDWHGYGRGCSNHQGWFVVDAVTYAGTALKAIDLRFDQRCDGGVPALRGKIHWVLF